MTWINRTRTRVFSRWTSSKKASSQKDDWAERKQSKSRRGRAKTKSDTTSKKWAISIIWQREDLFIRKGTKYIPVEYATSSRKNNLCIMKGRIANHSHPAHLTKIIETHLQSRKMTIGLQDKWRQHHWGRHRHCYAHRWTHHWRFRRLTLLSIESNQKRRSSLQLTIAFLITIRRDITATTFFFKKAQSRCRKKTPIIASQRPSLIWVVISAPYGVQRYLTLAALSPTPIKLRWPTVTHLPPFSFLSFRASITQPQSSSYKPYIWLTRKIWKRDARNPLVTQPLRV